MDRDQAGSMQRLLPATLVSQVKLVKSFARIHKANLINFGILPLVFADPDDYDRVEQGAELVIAGIRQVLARWS